MVPKKEQSKCLCLHGEKATCPIHARRFTQVDIDRAVHQAIIPVEAERQVWQRSSTKWEHTNATTLRQVALREHVINKLLIDLQVIADLQNALTMTPKHCAEILNWVRDKAARDVARYGVGAQGLTVSKKK